MIMHSLDKTSISQCWCRYAQRLPIALFWENKLECLIMKSLWAPRIFYLQANYDGTTPPFKLISLPSRFSFSQPSNDQFLLDISRAPSSQPINMNNWWLFYNVMAFPAAIGRELGLVVWSRIKDMYDLQNFKIFIQKYLPFLMWSKS